MNILTIVIHVTGVMRYYILMFYGTKGDVLETQTVPIADVLQDPFKTP